MVDSFFNFFFFKLLKLQSKIRQQDFFCSFLSRKLTIIALILLLNLPYWSFWFTRFNDLKIKHGNLPFLLNIKMILRIWGSTTVMGTTASAKVIYGVCFVYCQESFLVKVIFMFDLWLCFAINFGRLVPQVHLKKLCKFPPKNAAEN